MKVSCLHTSIHGRDRFGKTVCLSGVFCAVDVMLTSGVVQPFCTGSGEDTSPRAEAMPRASMPEVCMSSNGGLTALHRACQQGNFEAAKSLIAAGSDPSIRDDYWFRFHTLLPSRNFE